MATYWENSCSFGLRYVSWYKYLIVSLVFSHLGFWSGNLFLIAPLPDLCLLVPFYICLFLMVLFHPKSMTNVMILILIFPFLDGDIPRAPSYGVYISQLIRFARVSIVMFLILITEIGF